MTCYAKLEHRFPVPVDDLWNLIGDFGDVDKWSGRPNGCERDGRGIGSLRTLTLADGRVIVDRLDDEGPYFYTYSIVTSPFPVASYSATMRVAAVDSGTTVLNWSGTIEPDGASDDQVVALFEGAYRHGVSLIENALKSLISRKTE